MLSTEGRSSQSLRLPADQSERSEEEVANEHPGADQDRLKQIRTELASANDPPDSRMRKPASPTRPRSCEGAPPTEPQTSSSTTPRDSPPKTLSRKADVRASNTRYRSSGSQPGDRAEPAGSHEDVQQPAPPARERCRDVSFSSRTGHPMTSVAADELRTDDHGELRRGSGTPGKIRVLGVELRGFEPLTPSMRTRCATGLRYSPWNLS